MNKKDNEINRFKKRITELETVIKDLQNKNKKLEAELENKNKPLSQQNEAQPNDKYNEFIKANEVLWKKGADGNIEKLAYCPKCRLILLSVPSANPTKLVCTKCKFRAPFHPSAINTIIAGINKK
jgi:hypothetical protein